MKSALLAALFCLTVLEAAATEELRQLPLLGDEQKAGQVWGVVTRWTEAYDKRDLKGVMATFDPDEVFSFYGTPSQSYADLESGYRSAFAKDRAAADGRWATLAEEVYAEGKTAFVRGIAERQVKAADGSVKVPERNRCIDIYRLHGASDWKIFRTMCYPESKADHAP